MTESSSNEPSKVSGQFHSVKGTVVEAVGNVTGARSWQESGKREHVEGEAEINAAKAKGYVEGTKDRIVGYKDSVLGAVTGDSTKQTAGNIQKQKGQAQQEINKP